MMWKKSFVNVLLWALCLIAVGAALIFVIYSALLEIDPNAQMIALALPFGLIGGVFLLFFLFRLIIARLPLQVLYRKKEFPHVIEGVLFIAMITAGLALRIWNINFASENAAYYELAKVTDTGVIPQIVHGATFFYTLLLRVLFLVVGNHWVAGIWLQIVLQMLASVLLYFGIRKLAGPIPGIVCLSLVMLLHGEIMRGLCYSPDMMYLCIYAVGLLLVAAFVKRLTYISKPWINAILLLITGVYIGFVCYMDVTGVTLLAVAFCAVSVSGSRIGRSLLHTTWLVIVTAVSFLGCLLFDAISCGKGLVDILYAWIKMYNAKSIDIWFWYAKDNFVLWVVILCLLIFGFMGFWVSGRSQRYTPWVLMLGALYAIGCFNINVQYMSTMTLFAVACYTLIGVGIREVMSGYLFSDCIDTVEETVETAEEPVEEQSESPQESTESFETEETLQEETPVPDLQPRPPIMIHNPLPMPKTHVRRTPDYSFQPEEETMYYDFEVAEDDDFDL